MPDLAIDSSQLVSATSRIDRTVESALLRCSGGTTRAGARAWRVPAGKSPGRPIHVHIEEGWLLLDTTVAETSRGDPWWWLCANADLRHGVKFALTPCGQALTLRSEIPLDEALSAERVAAACATVAGVSFRFPVWTNGTGCRVPAGSVKTDAGDGWTRHGEADADDVEDLRRRCETAGWAPADDPGARLVVELDVADRFAQAVVRILADGRVRVATEVAFVEAPSGQCRVACGTLLLRACGTLRMARTAAGRDARGQPAQARASPTAACLEVVFDEVPTASALGHAFSALSVGLRVVARTAELVAHDPELAAAYLARTAPRGGNHNPQATSKKEGAER